MGNNIIGGMFGLENPSKINNRFPPFFTNNEIHTVNARSGLYLLSKVLKPRVVWMPSFLCSVMLEAVQDFTVKFYEVDHRLNPSFNWLNDIRNGDLVVVIDYFGFQFDPTLLSRITDCGGLILEDASQALLSSYVGKNSHFVLFSPRKILGIPDGGILRNNTTIDLSKINLINPPEEWWLKAFKASLLRREYDLYGSNRDWFRIFQDADVNGPIGQYAMSNLSKILLENSFDYSFIIKRRRNNYKTLNRYLSKIALFPELPDNVVPLGYPVCIPNRDFIRNVLFKNQIYPPVHWLIDGVVPKTYETSHKLANMILTLVCDQRYTKDDMEKTAKIVLRSITQ